MTGGDIRGSGLGQGLRLGVSLLSAIPGRLIYTNLWEWFALKKALMLVLLSVVMVALLAACGANDKEDAEAAAAPSASSSPAAARPSVSASPSEASAPAPAEITITHALGTETVKANPQKVVVFDYGTLDTLDKLGIEVTAVPKASLPPYLEKYKDAEYEDAGTLFEPDFEKLNKLKPDVILIGGRTAAVYDELKKIAPTIQTSVDTAKYAESFDANAKLIGEIFGKSVEVDAELAAIHAASEQLKGKAETAGKTLVILTTGGKISAYGPGSRFGIIHDVLGFAPVDSTIEASTHGQSISNEYILEKNPDILFVIDRDAVVSGEGGGKTAKDVIENELVKQTNAYKNGKIVYLDPSYWYLSGGGLVSGAEMVKEAAAAVQ